MEPAGRVALVTGAAMGIGFSITKSLADAGAHVVLADRDAEAGKRVAADVNGLFVRVDVGEDDELRRMIATAERFGGGLDILVNNAGGVDSPFYPTAPVERWTSKPISISCEITRWTCSSVARSCITTTISTSRY